MSLASLSPALIGALFAGILGSLIGSFANVVVHRLPLGASIAFPGSHCPACRHRLGPSELVPILSWAAQGGRCRSCRSPISVRYPLVEGIMAAGFVLLWLRWPPHLVGWAFVPLAVLFALLVILAAIDLDTYTLPDVLTFPALAIALLAPLAYGEAAGLPTWSAAMAGATAGAGILVLVSRVGALALRRLRDTSERLWPLGFDQVNLAAVGGAFAGWPAGLAIAAAATIASLATRGPVRLPEPIAYALWIAALIAAAVGFSAVGLWGAVAGSVTAAGATALVGGLYWWIRDLGRQSAAADDADDEPVAMGFGDVKLAAVLGALLGWEKLLLALFLSFVLGAAGGLLARAAGGERVVPFGPYLVVAGLLALFLGDWLITWYLGLLAF